MYSFSRQVGNLTTLSGVGIKNNYTCIIGQSSHITIAHGLPCTELEKSMWYHNVRQQSEDASKYIFRYISESEKRYTRIVGLSSFFYDTTFSF